MDEQEVQVGGCLDCFHSSCTAMPGAGWHTHVPEAAQHSQRMSVTPRGAILSTQALFRSSGVKEDVSFRPVSWYLKASHVCGSGIEMLFLFVSAQTLTS